MRSVAVYCGSASGTNPAFGRAAAELGRQLGQAGCTVVYGGSNAGLMGTVADAALAAGGKVIGVIPTRLVEREIAHPGLTELRVVETMHERKALMGELSDAVIALPGGTGTLDELFELFTWKQLGLHRKPMGLLDVAGYWQPLVAFLQHAVDERFLMAEHLENLLVSHDAGALLDLLASHQHRTIDKWLDRGGDQAVPNTRSPASPNPGLM